MNKFSDIYGIDACKRINADRAAEAINKVGAIPALERLAALMGEWSEHANKQADAGDITKAAMTTHGALLGAQTVIMGVIKVLREDKEPDK